MCFKKLMHEKIEFEQLNQHQVRPVEITWNPNKFRWNWIENLEIFLDPLMNENYRWNPTPFYKQTQKQLRKKRSLKP